MNLYRYAANNPMLYIDPSGLYTQLPTSYLPAFSGNVTGFGRGSSSPTALDLAYSKFDSSSTTSSWNIIGNSLGNAAYSAANSYVGPVRQAAVGAGVGLAAAALSLQPPPYYESMSTKISRWWNEPNFVNATTNAISNYPRFLGRELKAAGQSTVDTGYAVGNFAGDHVTMSFIDPREEVARINRAAIDAHFRMRDTANYFYNNPREAAVGAGGAAVDYADRLTSDPEVSGQFVSDYYVGWATSGAAGAGGQIVGRGAVAGSRFISQIDIADAGRALRVTNNPAHRFGGIRLGAPIKYSSGTFSITERGFEGYPAGIARPQGPFRVLEGAEYDAARLAADRVNQQLRAADPSRYVGQEIHEIQPVKFGGSPTDPANKIPLPTDVHRTQVTPWWNRFLRNQ